MPALATPAVVTPPVLLSASFMFSTLHPADHRDKMRVPRRSPLPRPCRLEPAAQRATTAPTRYSLGDSRAIFAPSPRMPCTHQSRILAGQPRRDFGNEGFHVRVLVSL